MKKFSLLTSMMVGLVTASLQAGTETFKQVAPPPPPPELYGLGFYSGLQGGANLTLRERDGDLIRSSSLTTWINTGAFIGNFIARFAFGRFQPYVGAGVGIYYAESAGAEFQGPHGTFNSGGGRSH